MAAESKAKQPKTKETLFFLEGKDKSGKVVKGEVRAAGKETASAQLRRQAITVTKIKKGGKSGKAVTEKDITLFTRRSAWRMAISKLAK